MRSVSFPRLKPVECPFRACLSPSHSEHYAFLFGTSTLGVFIVLRVAHAREAIFCFTNYLLLTHTMPVAVTVPPAAPGLKSYYQAKIEAAELLINQKTQNLRRLEAQRNALNARGRYCSV